MSTRRRRWIAALAEVANAIRHDIGLILPGLLIVGVMLLAAMLVWAHL